MKMARRAKRVRPSKKIESVYRSGLFRFLGATWERIKGDPEAVIEDIVEFIAIPVIDRFLDTSTKYNIIKVVESIAGISSADEVAAAATDVTDILKNARKKNVELITKMTDQQRTMAAEELGSDSEEPLAKRLEEKLGISKKRAKIIARDQTSKVNSQLSEERHKAAGAEKYRWDSSGDERVRPLHKALDGNIYEYGEPTGAEEGLPPGQPILCRCVAIAIFD